MAHGGAPAAAPAVDMTAALRRQENEKKVWVAPKFKTDTGGCTVTFPDESNTRNFILHVPGPDTYLVAGATRPCPFKGHTFRVSVTIPSAYPFKEPEAIFLDRPLHPNIEKDGNFCGDGLAWRPAKSIVDLAKFIVALIAQPNAESPADADVARMMTDNLATYEAEAAKGPVATTSSAK